MRVILYLLYGQNDAYRQCLRKDCGEPRIAVISDHPDPAPGLPVDHLRLSPGDIDNWSNHGQFHLRMKPLALRRALLHFGVPVVLVDTDTRLVASPARMLECESPAKSLMHCQEYSIGTDQFLVDKIGHGIDLLGYRLSHNPSCGTPE